MLLMLAITVAALWVWSNRKAGIFWLLVRDGDRLQIHVSRGEVEFQIIRERRHRQSDAKLVEFDCFADWLAEDASFHHMIDNQIPPFHFRKWVLWNFVFIEEVSTPPIRADHEKLFISEIQTKQYAKALRNFESVSGVGAVEMARIRQECRELDFDVENIDAMLKPVRAGGTWELSVPAWFIVGMLMIFPLMGARSLWIGRHNRRAGRCVKCGYDLRATPDRCPECGEIAKITG